MRPRGRGRLRSKRGRSLLFAGVAGSMAFTGVYGFAASLGLTTQTLGAASTTVSACQSATLTATYTMSYSATLPGYQVATVVVTGLASTCWNMAYKITLAGSGGTSLGEATGTTPGSGTSFTATMPSGIPAASVTTVNVEVTG